MSPTWRLRLNLVTFGVCASYITLGAANAGSARELWWVYGIVTFVLAMVELIGERRRR